jgi:endonuclease III related protein
MSLHAAALRSVFDSLYRAYGAQHWWPAESAFEVMVGAILVQNTAWANVERAIARLRAAELLCPQAMRSTPVSDLAELIRPAGYYNVKAKRLHGYCAAYLQGGGQSGLGSLATRELRTWLLAIKGIGPETADAILLYVFERPVFVVDAYARRIFGRLGLADDTERYEPFRASLERQLPSEVSLLQEYHALLVRLGKEQCRPQPRCGCCPLRAACLRGRERGRAVEGASGQNDRGEGTASTGGIHR